MTTENTTTSILDQMINSGIPAQTQTPDQTPTPAVAPVTTAHDPAHSFARGSQITEAGIRHIQARANSYEYRGQGVDVRALNNDPQAILEAAGMNWKTVPMPLALKGRTEYRDYPGMVGLVRSDTGAPLAVASTSYKPHHNVQLVNTMANFAKEANLTLARVGLFDSGSRGWAVAESGINREAKVGDIVTMRILMTFGHAPGTATQIKAWCEELRCSNGMSIQVAAGKARFVHSAELTQARITRAREFVMAAAQAFDSHVDKLAMLRQVRSNRALDLLMLAKTFEPAMAARAIERVEQMIGTPEGESTAVLEVIGARVLRGILERDSVARAVVGEIERKRDRLLGAVIEATDSQRGGSFTVGSMAHAFSGVTYYNSNVRGRSAETGLENNLSGAAAKDSQTALTVAVRTAELIRMEVSR